MKQFAERLIRAAQLERGVYEEVEADKGSLGQAALAVILSSVAAGAGLLSFRGSLEVFFWGMCAALIGWLFWAWMISLIGTRLMPEPQTSSDLGEMLRVLGFASAPGLLRIFAAVAPLRDIVFLVTSIWMVAAMVVAIRQALDYRSTGRAIGVCAVAWLLQTALFIVILKISGAFSDTSGISIE